MLRDKPLANENHQSCLRREGSEFFPHEDNLFLPIVVSRWAKKQILCDLSLPCHSFSDGGCLCGEQIMHVRRDAIVN
jgi:hypothetical protein